MYAPRRARGGFDARSDRYLGPGKQGNDDPAPDDAAKGKLRQQALAWLKAELTTWGNLLETAPPQGQVAISRILDHWTNDTDLAGIREAEALVKLSEAERKEWLALWKDVDSLRKRVRENAGR